MGVDIFRAAGTTPVFFQGIRKLSGQNIVTEDSESFINLLSENSAIISSDIFEDISSSDKKLHINTQFGIKSLIPIAVSQSKHLSNVVIMDIGNLQTIIKKPKKLSRIDIRLEADSNLKKTRIALLAFLRANQLEQQIRIVDPQSRETEISQLSSAYRGNLFVLGNSNIICDVFPSLLDYRLVTPTTKEEPRINAADRGQRYPAFSTCSFSKYSVYFLSQFDRCFKWNIHSNNFRSGIRK